MIEIYAAILGASLGVAGMSVSGFTRRTSESREAVIRLTAGVESIATKLEDLHQDMKAEKIQATMDRKEIYERLNNHGNRITVLESTKAKVD
jgi:hypothetical protein|tara:strand:+ start:362 stop:637 length:276 start_codon:yes stop_codon:yes gene_type:complete